MNDFLKGMIGKLLQMILGMAGFIFIAIGIVSCGTDHSIIGSICLVLSILCWAGIFGIRYWLGHIVRMR